MTIADAVRLLRDRDDIQGFRPHRGRGGRSGPVVLRLPDRDEELQLFLRGTGSHIVISATVIARSDCSDTCEWIVKAVMQSNLRSNLAALRFSHEGQEWEIRAECALLADEIEPAELVSAAESTISVWRSGNAIAASCRGCE